MSPLPDTSETSGSIDWIQMIGQFFMTLGIIFSVFFFTAWITSLCMAIYETIKDWKNDSKPRSIQQMIAEEDMKLLDGDFDTDDEEERVSRKAEKHSQNAKYRGKGFL